MLTVFVSAYASVKVPPLAVFNFCGPAAIGEAAQSGVVSSDNAPWTWMGHLLDRDDDSFDQSVGMDFYQAMKQIQLAYVSRMEIAAQRGDGKSFAWHSKAFLDFFNNMYSGPFVKKGHGSLDALLSYEYALSRIILDRRDSAIRLSPDACRSILPTSLFAINTDVSSNISLAKRYERARSFRNALIVGCAIECYLRDKKTLPTGLDAIEGLLKDEKVDSAGRPFCYRHDGALWSLSSCDEKPLKTYVPAIADVSNMRDWIPLVFASDYTRRRRELFVSGKLEICDSLSVWVVGTGNLCLAKDKPPTATSFSQYGMIGTENDIKGAKGTTSPAVDVR